MALLLKKDLSSGVKAEYLSINIIEINMNNDAVRVVLEGYLTEKDKRNGYSPLITETKYFSGAKEVVAGKMNALTTIYEMLKKTEDFFGINFSSFVF